jgi:hypothetical protein
LKQTTLANVIRRNTGITNLQDNVFFVGGGGAAARNGHAPNVEIWWVGISLVALDTLHSIEAPAIENPGTATLPLDRLTASMPTLVTPTTGPIGNLDGSNGFVASQTASIATLDRLFASLRDLIQEAL